MLKVFPVSVRGAETLIFCWYEPRSTEIVLFTSWIGLVTEIVDWRPDVLMLRTFVADNASGAVVVKVLW